jgi:prevent-host-death family protein
MTRTISASVANQAFSKMLRDVQQGDDFIVMSRGRAVARVIPYAETRRGGGLAALVDRLERLPTRRLEGWTREDLYE